MNLVVLGYSAREIAERMNVIYQCVANHLPVSYTHLTLPTICSV